MEPRRADTDKHADRLMRWAVAAALIAASAALWWPLPSAAAVRVKEVASVRGARNNPLVRASESGSLHEVRDASEALLLGAVGVNRALSRALAAAASLG